VWDLIYYKTACTDGTTASAWLIVWGEMFFEKNPYPQNTLYQPSNKYCPDGNLPNNTTNYSNTTSLATFGVQSSKA
jgi:hypothetical protein